MSDSATRTRLSIAAFSAVDLSLPQGHAIHLRSILEALHARGHCLFLIAPRPRQQAPTSSFRTFGVPILRWHVFGPWSFEFLGGISLLLLCLGRRIDLLYVRHDLYTSAPAIIARLLRIPLVVEVNSSIPNDLALAGKTAARRLALACERFNLRGASAILVLADEQVRAIARRTGADPKKIVTVPIGSRIPHALEPLRSRRESGVSDDRFVVGFAGNLSPIQGVDLLIDAFAGLGDIDAELWIIGTGEEEEKLRDRAESLVGRVRFWGGVDLDRAEFLLSACQLLVAPYRREGYDRVSEGGSLSSKVLTYLAVDRPVLISDIGSYAWLREIGAGRAFASGDPDSLAREVRTYYRRWCDAGAPLLDWPEPSPGPGRRYVENGRSWDDIASMLEETLFRVVARNEPLVPERDE